MGRKGSRQRVGGVTASQGFKEFSEPRETSAFAFHRAPIDRSGLGKRTPEACRIKSCKHKVIISVWGFSLQHLCYCLAWFLNQCGFYLNGKSMLVRARSYIFIGGAVSCRGGFRFAELLQLLEV